MEGADENHSSLKRWMEPGLVVDVDDSHPRRMEEPASQQAPPLTRHAHGAAAAAPGGRSSPSPAMARASSTLFWTCFSSSSPKKCAFLELSIETRFSQIRFQYTQFVCLPVAVAASAFCSLSLSKPKSLKKKILSSRGSAVGGGGSSRSFFCSCLPLWEVCVPISLLFSLFFSSFVWFLFLSPLSLVDFLRIWLRIRGRLGEKLSCGGCCSWREWRKRRGFRGGDTASGQ